MNARAVIRIMLALLGPLAACTGPATDEGMDAAVRVDARVDARVDEGSDASDASGADDAAGRTDAGQAVMGNIYPDDPEIVAAIEAMGDYSSIELEYRVAGERAEEWVALYGGAPQRRDFGNKIAYAPDRGTGMYAGMNHGVPHRINDAWEYHLGSNTWHLLFFPDPQPRTAGWFAEHAMIEDGYLQTRRHGMINGAHTWDGITYDPEVRRMYWANVNENRPMGLAFERRVPLEAYAYETGQSIEDVTAQLLPGTHLWMFDGADGRWYRHIGARPYPRMIMQGAALEYISDLRKTVWYTCQWNESGMWAYDSATNEWTSLAPNGGANVYHDNEEFTFPMAEAQMRYGQGSRTMVAVLRNRTWHYDIDRNEWSLANVDEENNTGDWITAFSYDSKNDVFLLVQPSTASVRAYHVRTRTWETLPVNGPPVRTNMAPASYYDPVHNVMVVLDGRAQTMWLYRYH